MVQVFELQIFNGGCTVCERARVCVYQFIRTVDATYYNTVFLVIVLCCLCVFFSRCDFIHIKCLQSYILPSTQPTFEQYTCGVYLYARYVAVSRSDKKQEEKDDERRAIVGFEGLAPKTSKQMFASTHLRLIACSNTNRRIRTSI